MVVDGLGCLVVDAATVNYENSHKKYLTLVMEPTDEEMNQKVSEEKNLHKSLDY